MRAAADRNIVSASQVASFRYAPAVQLARQTVIIFHQADICAGMEASRVIKHALEISQNEITFHFQN